ncbi:MAG: putative CBS domain family transcriptional regulator [Candidatus Nanosalina sp. J07AB43]|jgi:Predicted signal-transduction protein containing cAMP-binding and CBS domains|nr:MAG: putative CBS domain family transcriptional regulator [Candidatus Nanosalina sp. J07AB43]
MEGQVELNEVMTEGVIAIEKDENIVKASKLLQDEEIRGLVVIDDEDAVGVIVCRDIVYQVVSEGEDPTKTTVADVMSTDLIVAEEDEYLDDVAMAMSQNDVSRVPVVRGDMLVGIVTQSDILRAWPGMAEIMSEDIEMEAEATPRQRSQSGVCDECDNYSENIVEAEGRLLCEECR